jgi:uncharacterized cupin superfamily protein
MLKGDINRAVAPSGKSGYPPPHDEKLKGRKTWSLTRQWKLTQFGVNMVELPPGAWSTNRHWHRNNDELVVVISGELVVVTDEGEEVIGPGDCIAFKVYYDIGGRDAWDVSTFPDIGLEAYTHQELRFRPIREKE